MSWRDLPARTLWAAGAVLVVIFGVVLWLLWPRPAEVPTESQPTALEPLPGVTLTYPVDLYFPGRDGRLHAERRELELPEEARGRIRRVLETLLAGPQDPGLVAPLPDSVTLAGVYVGAQGVVYIDLLDREGGPPPPMGSREEMQVVYSLVDTVALNISEARRVVVLWNGRQGVTLAGHLDLSRPLAPNTDLVAR